MEKFGGDVLPKVDRLHLQMITSRVDALWVRGYHTISVMSGGT